MLRLNCFGKVRYKAGHGGLCDLPAGSSSIADRTCIAQFGPVGIAKAALRFPSPVRWLGLGGPDWPVWTGCVSQDLQDGVGEMVSGTGGASPVPGQILLSGGAVGSTELWAAACQQCAVRVTSDRLCKLVQPRDEFF